MDIRTRITEFIEKRSKNKVTTIKEERPSSPWWRRFSRFRRFFIRKKKNKVSPMVDNASIIKDGNSTSEMSQSPCLTRRAKRRNGLFLSKSESFVKDHRPEDASRSQVDSSRDSGIADTSGEGTTASRQISPRKSVAWSVSFLSGGVEENGSVKDALPKNGKFLEKESSMDPRVLWKLVNADSSVLSEDEWASFHDNDDAIDDEGERNQYALSNNLQSLQDFSEEMTYMLHRATVTWSNICRGPFPSLKNHNKDQVVEMMSRGCIDNTNRMIAKFDAIMEDVNHLIGEVDDHLGQQIDFKDRIQHDRDLKSKRPGMIDLAWSYLKPKGFPTRKYNDSLDMVVEEVDDDVTTDNLE